MELLWAPILALLLVNRRRGISANGSSKDKIIWTHKVMKQSMFILVGKVYFFVFFVFECWAWLTEAMIISLAAPEDPPMMQTIKLGAMAMHRVTKFLNQSLIFKSRKPCKTKHYKVFSKIIPTTKLHLQRGKMPADSDIRVLNSSLIQI